MENEAIEKLIENEKEWRRYIVREMSAVKTEQVSQGKAIASLKVRASIWGFISGSIPAGVVLCAAYLKSKL